MYRALLAARSPLRLSLGIALRRQAALGAEEADVDARERVEIEDPVGPGDGASRAGVGPAPGNPVAGGKAGEVEQTVGVAGVLQPGAAQFGDPVSEAAADQDHGTASGSAATGASSAVSAVSASRMRARAGVPKCSSTGIGSTITTPRP